MRTRIMAFLVTLILFLAYTTMGLAGGQGATIADFPDDPGIPPGSE